MEHIKNRVLNMSWENLLPQIKDKSIDLLLTDPPFGMKFQSGYRKIKHKNIANDDNLDWLSNWISQVSRILKDDAHAYIFCSWHNIDVFKQEVSLFLNIKNILIWEKNNTGMGDLFGDYAPQYEMILFCSNGNKKLNGGRHSNIIKSPRTQNNLHPTEKPVDLLKFLIEKSTTKGDIVLDTFAGSFSTAKASKIIHRDFIACEIDKDYCIEAEKLLSRLSIELF